ncbi:hypothetical protein M0805_001710 [Coniferiporia weirii]|nr:hypothetical protein M0805_001710 [Coniferiporia weirii]
MKRGAEKQLTKDHSDEDDIEEVDLSQGFKKADETTLAARPIRGLPKRNAFSAPQPPSLFGTSSHADKPPAAAPAFKGFGSASSSPFTFLAPSPASVSTPTLSSTISSTAQAPIANSPFKFPTAAPVHSAASPATKQFASFLGPTQLNGTPTIKSPMPEEDPAVKYFISLRGLNGAFRDAVAKLVDQDPFIDLAEALNEYRSLRTTIQKEFDGSKKASAAANTNGPLKMPSILNFGSGVSTNESKPTPAPAAPPASFAGFGTPSISTSSIPTSGFNGFKPPPVATPSTSSTPQFLFGAPTVTSEKTPSASSAFTPSNTSAFPASTSIFISSDATSKPSLFGNASAPTSLFGGPSTASADKPLTSVFGTGSVFGGASSTTTGATTTPPSLFGGNKALGSTSTPAFNSLGSEPSGFAFGPKAIPKENLGNPVGFSFGSSTPTPEPEGSAAPVAEGGATPSKFGSGSTSAPSGFAFGAVPNAAVGASQDPGPSVDSRDQTPGSVDSSEAPAEGAAASTPKALGDNPNDLEGEGEQDEETLHTSRVKIFKFAAKDDQPHWAEVGVGMLRIKRHKTTGQKRLLSRNSGNGKIMMNFNLYSGLKTTRAKQVLNFVGHDNGASVTYRVRVKDEAGAIALKEAIDKEVPA